MAVFEPRFAQFVCNNMTVEMIEHLREHYEAVEGNRGSFRGLPTLDMIPVPRAPITEQEIKALEDHLNEVYPNTAKRKLNNADN